MLLTVCEAAKAAWPQGQIRARLRPDEQGLALAEGIIPVIAAPDGVAGSVLNKWNNLRTTLRAGALWDVGGYQFGDRWGSGVARRRLRLVHAFRRLGKPSIFFPQAWGPFEDQTVAEATRHLLDECRVAYARDLESVRWLETICGGTHPCVRFAHDVAWAFRGGSPDDGRQVVDRVFGSRFTDRPVICITPNLRMHEKQADQEHGSPYVGLLERVCRMLLARQDIRVLLVGHEIRRVPSRADDRSVCRTLLTHFQRSDAIAMVDDYLSAREVKAVIGACAAYIGSRYHGTIAALSQGINCAVAGWSHKYDQLMAEFSLQEQIFSDTTEPDALERIVHGVVDRRGELRGPIEHRAAELRTSAEGVLEEVTGSARLRV